MTNLKSRPLTVAGLNRRRFLQTSSSLGIAAATIGATEVVFAGSKKILKVRAYADLRSLDPAFSQGVMF